MKKEWDGKIWELWEDPYYWIKSYVSGKLWSNYKTWLELAEESQGKWVLIQKIGWKIGERRFLWWYLTKEILGIDSKILFEISLNLKNICSIETIFKSFLDSQIILRNLARCDFISKFLSNFLITLRNFIKAQSQAKSFFYSVITLAKLLSISVNPQIKIYQLVDSTIVIYNWWQNNTTWTALSSRNNGLWYRT